MLLAVYRQNSLQIQLKLMPIICEDTTLTHNYIPFKFIFFG